MKSLIVIIGVVSLQAIASDGCIMQEKTVNQKRAVITERSEITRSVLAGANGDRRCTVDFRVKIGNDWHQAHGDISWDGQRPSNEACAAAVLQAEREVEDRISKRSVISESTLICRDDPDRARLKTANPGTVAALDQYRPHPDYPKPFYHNGTQCRYFLENGYANNDVRRYTGVICELQDKKWVVVDRF